MREFEPAELDAAPKECATVDCFGVGRVWYAIALFWSLFASAIVVSAAWLARHWRRANTAGGGTP